MPFVILQGDRNLRLELQLLQRAERQIKLTAGAQALITSRVGRQRELLVPQSIAREQGLPFCCPLL